jgi:hypothetical protein
MQLRFWGTSGVALLALNLMGCEQDRSPTSPGAVGGGGGSGGTSSPVSCESTTPGPAPLRPLTRFQYDNIVRDLLGDSTRPAQAFPPENEVDGYRTYAAANIANPLLVERYLTTAEAVATRAVQERLAELAPCDDGADASVCGQLFISSFAKRAFRRPATEAELAPLVRLFEAGRAESYAKGIELTLQAVLQSPQFLYRVDGLKAPTVETGAIALGPYELASRLSFGLWGSVPDVELLLAADEGRLTTAADVEREARRMLDDERARDIVKDFGDQWLGLSRLDGAVREGTDVDVNVLNDALRDSLHAFLADAYFGQYGSFERMFTEPKVWMNETLATLYGAAPPASGFEPQSMADPRAGLLTQPGLLTLLSHSNQTAPVIRGVFVRERFLCMPVPPPPPDVNAVPPDPDPSATTRERFRQHTEQEACAGCHRLIDGIGFGFERYDQLGRYRESEHGLTVDESGEVVATGEAGLDGPFAGLTELSSRLATSELARDCLVTHWYRYSFGRQEQPADTCSIDQVKERFASSGGSLKELLVGLTQTDAFLYRPAITEAP